ncbi:hypothetical protein [Malonomonas rubra]|uniref:hypothetical protein n=1 Tax=Malonomonas rubra TaxID=57040 RepID=UPI0026F2BC7C|nr:hypothetical protein [Malonomonas rubra]
MIVKCPKCKVRLRSPQNVSKSSLQVSCPQCRTKFKIRKKYLEVTVLVAHEDEVVCQLLRERFGQLDLDCLVCRNDSEVFFHLQEDRCTVLLLDVAFNGTFPFQLIERVKASRNVRHKVVLLPSVYNRTAYKKRPESLYGADAYLELHHIGDRLLPLLGELHPELAARFAAVDAPAATTGGERSLRQTDVHGQASILAKLLVADILLYNQELLENGLESGQLEQLFAEQLDEGRRMLVSRLPAAEDFSVDFIQQAFDAACQTYSCN